MKFFDKKIKLEHKLQLMTVVISIITVIVSIFAAIMAFNASVTSTRISSELLKNNELETRIYEQRYELFKNISTIFSEINENNGVGIEKALELEKQLKKYGYEIRVIGTPYMICAYNDLILAIKSYIDFITNDSPAHSSTSYKREIIPMLFQFDKAFRGVLYGGEDFLELEFIGNDSEGINEIDTCSSGQLNSITPEQY